VASPKIDTNAVLTDQIRNTIEILRFLDKMDHPQDQIEAAKEECVERMMHYFSGTRSPAIDYFLQAYIKLLQNKYDTVDISK
jgi:aminopeptidase C